VSFRLCFSVFLSVVPVVSFGQTLPNSLPKCSPYFGQAVFLFLKTLYPFWDRRGCMLKTEQKKENMFGLFYAVFCFFGHF
jgi:hypothetical protein